MNKDRLKEIEKAVKGFSEAMGAFKEAVSTARGAFDDFKSEIERIKSEEEEYRDNMPENMQSGEKYERAENAINQLDECETAIGELESFFDDADNIEDKTNEATSPLESIE